MKISYVTFEDAKDIHAWSGTIFHLINALQFAGNEVEYIDKLRCKPTLFSKIRYVFAKLRKHKYLWRREFRVAKSFATEIIERISPNTEVIFSAGSLPVSLLKTDKKTVFYADANFAQLANYYESYSNLSKRSIMLGNALEKQALENCDLAIYASDWAAKSAIKDYGANPSKVKVIPLGANIECTRVEKDIENIINSKSKNVCNLLFLGVDWKRKGGDIALKIVEQLRNNNIPVFLHVVGIKDQTVVNLSYVKNYGFISKSTPDGIKQIEELMCNAHFLLLPTQAECFGVVFCEAASFGLPSISTKTGGVTSAIKDNVTGMTFDLSATPIEYADYIANLFNDTEAYKKLALSSFYEYKTRLNWDVSGRAILKLIKEMF